jgi:hypothetical protein
MCDSYNKIPVSLLSLRLSNLCLHLYYRKLNKPASSAMCVFSSVKARQIFRINTAVTLAALLTSVFTTNRRPRLRNNDLRRLTSARKMTNMNHFHAELYLENDAVFYTYAYMYEYRVSSNGVHLRFRRIRPWFNTPVSLQVHVALIRYHKPSCVSYMMINQRSSRDQTAFRHLHVIFVVYFKERRLLKFPH